MLNISGLNEGIVLDHIQAGKSLDIYYNLGLDKLDCQVAIIKNARSNKMGRKDIIKKIFGRPGMDRSSPSICQQMASTLNMRTGSSLWITICTPVR